MFCLFLMVAVPLPLLEDTGHEEMVGFLKNITTTLGTPSAIVLISAHWEEDEVVITSGKSPPLIYDYYGFPDEAYDIKYPALGDPVLANKIFNSLQKKMVLKQDWMSIVALIMVCLYR